MRVVRCWLYPCGLRVNRQRLELLQDMALFGGIREAVLAALLERSVIRHVPQGAFFFREDEAGDAMYVLEQGRVSVSKHGQGQAYTLCELGAGDSFGEMALIDLGPRSASVMALEDCRAIALTYDGLYALYTQDLEQFTLIQMNLARELSRRLRAADDQIFQDRIRHGGYPLAIKPLAS